MLVQVDTYHDEPPYPKSVELGPPVNDEAVRTVPHIPAQPLDTNRYQLVFLGWAHLLREQFTDPWVDLQGDFLRYHGGLTSLTISPDVSTAG